jgi:hypothetical protein
MREAERAVASIFNRCGADVRETIRKQTLICIIHAEPEAAHFFGVPCFGELPDKGDLQCPCCANTIVEDVNNCPKCGTKRLTTGRRAQALLARVGDDSGNVEFAELCKFYASHVFDIEDYQPSPFSPSSTTACHLIGRADGAYDIVPLEVVEVRAALLRRFGTRQQAFRRLDLSGAGRVSLLELGPRLEKLLRLDEDADVVSSSSH